ncbi:MAG: hypothetical protein C5B54_04000 [Acidobacteria bacterium]|nr:MAG: hypothetical protein C5B54_04000 [Acidobacteriota bacterium]
MKKGNSGLLILMSFLFVIAIGLAFVQSQQEKMNDVYAGTVVPKGGGRPVSVKLYAQGVTSDTEAHALASTLKSGGQDALVKAMEKMDNGRFAPPIGVGTRVAVVRIRKTEKGQRITMVTDRPITFPELWNSTRSTDYPFGIVQLDLDDKGSGEGTIIVAAKIKFTSDDTIEVESYSLGPHKIMSVRKL